MSYKDIRISNFETLDDAKTDPSQRKTQINLSRSLRLKDLNHELQLATVEEFVKRFNGNRTIKRLLIATNGIAAVKCIRSLRQWCLEMFNNDKAISCIAMVTPEDLTANAEYIKLADQHISIPGGDIENNYENPDLITEIAIQVKADAVWLGWGLNGGNVNLPLMLKKEDIAYAGPSTKSLAVLGDKISSLILAQSMDIPTLPWSGIGLRTNFANSKKFKVPSEMHLQACVNSAEEGMEIALQIKFPVLIMASRICGIKGFRLIQSPNDFISAFRQIQTEVPDSKILVMKTIPNARHMESQILADKHGNVIRLFNRDCNIFRHHRKIIVEGPSTAALPKVLDEMDKAAAKLARAADFVGIGSVEYIYDPKDGQYYFIEFIPHLQIEHPITELISQVNLISCQIQIAMGVSLNRIKDIRLLYKENPFEDTSIDFEKPRKKLKPLGHVIGARIISENPDDGIKMSSSGTVEELTFQSTKNAHGYFCFSALSDLMDSQFGHCFAWGESRQDARSNLMLALKELQTRGDFKTSIEYLILIAERNEFLQNNFDAGFLNTLIAKNEKEFESSNIMLGIICTSILVADREISDAFAHFQMELEAGHFPSITLLSNVVAVELIHDGIKFNIEAVKSGPNSYTLILNKSLKEVEFNRLNDGGIMVRLENTNYTAHLKEDDDVYSVKVGSQSIAFEKDHDTTILRSPVHGKLIKLLVEDGTVLMKDQPYAEVECEKEILVLESTDSGKVTFRKHKHQMLNARSIIGTLELESPIAFKPKVYEQAWAIEEKPYVQEDHIQMLKKYKTILENQLNGFCLPDANNENHLYKYFRKFIAHLKTPMLPLFEIKEALLSVSKRIPPHLEQAIREQIKLYEVNIDSVVSSFPSEELAFVIDDFVSGLNKRSERDAFYITIQDILKIIQRYKKGFRGYEKEVLNELLNNYYSVENNFRHGMYDKCLAKLRETYKHDLKVAVNLIFSHSHVQKKNLLASLLIDEMSKIDGITEDLEETLKNLTTLNDDSHAKVALRARKFLVAVQKPSYDIRKNLMGSILLSVAEQYGSTFSTEKVKTLISSETLIFDILHEFFFHQRQNVCKIALEIYVRRVYMPYDIVWLQHWEHTVRNSKTQIPVVHFQFIMPENHPCNGQEKTSSSCKRRGCIAAIESLDILYDVIKAMIESFDSVSETQSEENRNFTASNISANESKEELMNVNSMEPIYVINIAIRNCGDLQDSKLCGIFESLLEHHRNEFLNNRIRRISFMALKDTKFPKIFTYRARDNFKEDIIYRNLEPANAFQYELHRLKNYELENIPTQNRKIHMYLGRGKSLDERIKDYRIFIRSKVIHSDFVSKDASFEYLAKEGEHSLLEAMDEIDLASSYADYQKCDCNHIFLNFLPCVAMSPNGILESLTKLMKTYENRLWGLHVQEVEMKLVTHKTDSSEKTTLRICFSNESGYFLDIFVYEEVEENKVFKFKSIGDRSGPWHGLQVSTPYKIRSHLQQSRMTAHEKHTSYCYDFPDMFHQMTEKLWKEFLNERKLEDIHIPDKVLLECVELILTPEGRIEEVQRPLGDNDIGMVAWRMRLATPEYPQGRELIVIANDVTHLNGMMGIKENLLFLRVSELSRKRRIPRIFISCSSGARAGFDEEIKSMFKIAWHDPKNPFKGSKYIYLSPEDYSKVSSKNIVHAVLIEDKGESRYKITDIIGHKEGIGIENLRYAAMVASETSKAYEEVVTISMVTSHTIGISSNIVQLGSRVVQIGNSILVSTNFNAANKQLGKVAYTSNSQLGGSHVLQQNGITQKFEESDVDGIYRILKWLSYIPEHHGSHLPIIVPCDPINRDIIFTPTKAPYDPRNMLAGHFNEDVWEPGFFDNGSFCEIMQEWARSAVTGRARLGGIPVGVIAAETRTYKFLIPSDPANEKSEEILVQKEGKILYSDTALKIVRAISDFSREELPLFIFANWMGFSGNLKDVHEGVLKFGNEIVEALRKYSKPILIYLPPHAVLRGAAWMTFDSLINPNYIETYADPEAHASIYDPESMIEMNFNQDDLKQLIQRLDPTINEWKNEEITNKETERVIELNLNTKNQIESLVPVYRNAVASFAALHETPKRALEKGCINDIIPWKTSRTFFYGRLKRLLMEEHFVEKICKTHKEISANKAKLMLRRWFMEHKGEGSSHHYDSDEKFIKWLEDQKNNEKSVANRNLNDVRKHSIVSEVTNLLEEHPESVLDAVVGLCRNLSVENLNEVARLLTQLTVETRDRVVLKKKSDTESEHSAMSDKSDSIESIKTI